MGSSLHLNTPAACGEHGTMFVAFELGKTQWKLGIVLPGKARLSRYVIDGGDTEAAWQLIAKARARAEKQLGGPVRVMSCYEAGYDGFWLHRWLLARGMDNQVIDPASLQVNRRKRRAKTDRLDLEQLIGALIRLLWGDRLACKVVHVPSPAQEDDRRAWREHGRLMLVEAQIGEIEAQAEAARKAAAPSPLAVRINQLIELKSLGPVSSQTLVGEVFFRDFKNRRQVGSYFGLTGTPFDSGDKTREQGISKAGNPRARTAAVELAWLWRRHQPASTLSRWFEERVGHQKGRVRRIAIVALARKLMVALWRFLEHGVVPEGANLRAAPHG